MKTIIFHLAGLAKMRNTQNFTSTPSLNRIFARFFFKFKNLDQKKIFFFLCVIGERTRFIKIVHYYTL